MSRASRKRREDLGKEHAGDNNTQSAMATGTPESWGSGSDHFFKILLRDINPDMVAAWKDPEAFGDRERFDGLVEVGAKTTSTLL